jgi:hypothetical protein
MLDLAGAMEDAGSEFTKMWNQEHAVHLLNELLKAVAPEFSPKSIDIFRRLAINSESVDVVARELKMTKNACIVARSRVFRRLKSVDDEAFGPGEGFLTR